MRTRDEDVRAAFSRERWRVWADDMRRSWGCWAGLVAMFALLFALAAMPIHSAGIVEGEVVGYHVSQDYDGRGPVVAQVRLADGRRVDVSLSYGSLLPHGARVRVEIFRSTWPLSSERYAFRGFVETSDQTDTHEAR